MTEQDDKPDVDADESLADYDESIGDVDSPVDADDMDDAVTGERRWADMEGDELSKAIVDDFDTTLQPFRDAGLTPEYGRVTVDELGGHHLDLRFVDADGNAAGWMERTINAATGEVKHDYFALKRAWQGQGLATRQGALAEDLYRARGMSHISVEANIDVGGYTWARMGYDWDLDGMVGFEGLPDAHAYAESLFAEIEAAVFDAPAITNELEALGELRAMLDKGVTPPPIAFARIGAGGSEVGKKTMLGSLWYGRKKL